MNGEPVNQVAVNDSSEVWSWYGAADIAIQATGALAIGATLSGDSSIQVQSDAIGYLQAMPPFAPASVVIEAVGEVAYGVTGSGLAEVVLTSTGQGTRVVMGLGASNIVFEADGDAQVVEPAAASFVVVVQASIDERVTPGVMGEGSAQIRVTTTAEDHRAVPIWLESEDTPVVVATIGYPRLVVQSPAGSAAITLASSCEARLGGRVELQPLPAELSLYTRGELGFRHYVYAEGECSIAVQSMALSHGRPQIPTDYIAAPAIRLLRVAKDDRRFTVPAERRL